MGLLIPLDGLLISLNGTLHSLSGLFVFDASPSPPIMMTKPPLVHADAHDELNASAANKERPALNHFNFFLQTHCPQIGIDVAVADDIPCRGPPKKSNRSSELVFEFWDLMIGAFITHMGNHARIGCDPEAERLKRGTAAQHCSLVKGFFTNKFRSEPEIPVFQDKPWSKLMTKLRGVSRGQPSIR